MANELSIRVFVLDQATGKLKEVKATVDSVGKSKGIDAIKTGFGMGIGAVVIQKAAMAVQGALSAIVTGALEDEAAMAKLRRAMGNAGLSFDSYAKAVEGAIDANVRKGFTDVETIDSLALLVTATKSVDEAMRFQAAAMDLARLKGISLEEATAALTKVEAGQYRMLKSLGIVLPSTATALEALTAVEQAAGGQAADYAATTQGAIKAIGAAFDKLASDVGAALLPALKGIADALNGAVVPAISYVVKDTDALRTAALIATPVLAVGLVNALRSVAVAAWAATGPLGILVGALAIVATALTVANEIQPHGIEKFAAEIDNLTVSVKRGKSSVEDMQAMFLGLNDNAALVQALKQDQEAMAAFGLTTDSTGKLVKAIPGTLQSVAKGLAAAAPQMEAASTAFWVSFPSEAAEAYRKVLAAGREWIADQTSQIRSARAALASAWTDALDAGIRAQEIAIEKERTLAAMADADLKRRLASKSATVRRAAQLELAQLQQQYIALLAEDANYGTNAEKAAKLTTLLQSQALKDGLASTDEDVRKQWELVYVETKAALDKIQAEIEGRTWTTPRLEDPSDPDPPINPRSGPTPLASGTNYVPQNMLAFLHKGEAVVPREYNRAGGLGTTVNVYIENAFGDGPAMDRLSRTLASRLRLAGI